MTEKLRTIDDVLNNNTIVDNGECLIGNIDKLKQDLTELINGIVPEQKMIDKPDNKGFTNLGYNSCRDIVIKRIGEINR